MTENTEGVYKCKLETSLTGIVIKKKLFVFC